MRRLIFAVASVLAMSGCASIDKVSPDLSPDSIYKIAQNSLLNSDYSNASRYYEALSLRFPNNPLTRKGEIELAYTYYENDDLDQALAVCERFLKIYPDDTNADYALYLKALIYYEKNQYKFSELVKQDSSDRDSKTLSESFLLFKELVTRYPDSVFRPDAQRYLSHIDFLLAKHNFDIALFYLKHGAYSAALSRFQGVIIEHPTSSLRKESLSHIIDCYNLMGMKEMAADTKKVLLANYPNVKA